LGHEVALQMHSPLGEQACPVAHAAHVAAAAPQEVADSEAYGSQVPVGPPLQQPFGQVVASQVHCPRVVSQSPFVHAVHAPPALPQRLALREDVGTQVLPLQQPAGQETASQTQRPVVVLHSCPVPHAAHARPPAPQDMDDSDAYGTQAPAAVQQPIGQETELQTHSPLPLQVCPAGQAMQAAPAAPQEVADSAEGCWHVPALQQPGHEVPAQVHAPPLHDSPLSQAAHALPPTPHRAADCEDARTHVLPLQQPVGHEVASQTHPPLVVLHSWPAVQAAQTAPAVPHCMADCEVPARHSPVLVQQPAQLAAQDPGIGASLVEAWSEPRSAETLWSTDAWSTVTSGTASGTVVWSAEASHCPPAQAPCV
jgi:hypothetical protein